MADTALVLRTPLGQLHKLSRESVEWLDFHLPDGLSLRSEIHTLLARVERSQLQMIVHTEVGRYEAEQVRRVIADALPTEDVPENLVDLEFALRALRPSQIDDEGPQ